LLPGALLGLSLLFATFTKLKVFVARTVLTSPLESILARRFVNADSKCVAQRLNPLQATLAEKPREGAGYG
jgi:hypothetical protein